MLATWKADSSRAWRRVKRALSPARTLGGRAPKWLRIALYVVVGSLLLYLLVANVILRTRLLRGSISKDESALKLEYRSAWSLYPGHVALRDLSLRYQDGNVQMLILLDRATLNINLLALTGRTLHVSKLTAERVTYRMRQKLESVEGQEERVRAFPPIAGFADPPVEHKVPKPPIPDDQYELWTIDLPDISATLREVWTMKLRYRGEGTVRGGFYVKPQRKLLVLPSVMLTHGGLFSLGDRELIRGGESRLDARLGPFDVRVPQGVEVLRYLSGEIHQSGELVLSSIAATYLPTDTALQVTRGVGPVTVDIAIARGILAPSTRVTFHTDDVALNAPSLAVHTDLRLVAHVDTSTEKPAVVVETTLEHATGTPMEVRGARAMVDLGNADLAAPFAIVRASGAVTSAHSGDLHAWQPLAPENVSFDGGSATFAARGELHGGALEGRLDLELEEARMTIGTSSFAASGKVWSNVASQDIDKVVMFPGTGGNLHDVALRLGSAQTSGLWVRSRFENAKLSTTAPTGFDADIGVDSGPGDRTLELFTRTRVTARRRSRRRLGRAARGLAPPARPSRAHRAHRAEGAERRARDPRQGAEAGWLRADRGLPLQRRATSLRPPSPRRRRLRGPARRRGLARREARRTLSERRRYREGDGWSARSRRRRRSGALLVLLERGRRSLRILRAVGVR